MFGRGKGLQCINFGSGYRKPFFGKKFHRNCGLSCWSILHFEGMTSGQARKIAKSSSSFVTCFTAATEIAYIDFVVGGGQFVHHPIFLKFLLSGHFVHIPLLCRFPAQTLAGKPCSAAVSFGSPLGTLYRRRKLHIPRPAASGRSRSFRCSSSSQKVLRLFGSPIVMACFPGENICRTIIQLQIKRIGLAIMIVLRNSV